MTTEPRLTLHVLDTTHGRPAVGVAVTVARLTEDGPVEVAELVTDDDGRSPGPVLAGDALVPGTYQLEFAVGPYFDPSGTAPHRYLDLVPVRVGIAATDVHVHVALLVTPWSYTTYRGS